MTSPHEDARRIDDLLLEYLPVVRAYVRLNVDAELRAHESCSDLVQTVCREVLTNADRLDYRDERSFKGWLFTVVLNKIRDRHRYWKAAKRTRDREQALDGTQGAFHELYASIATPSAIVARGELEATLEAAFDAMPPRYREVITLSRIAGLTNEEIAQRLGITNANARMLLSRALARLATLVNPG